MLRPRKYDQRQGLLHHAQSEAAVHTNDLDIFLCVTLVGDYKRGCFMARRHVGVQGAVLSFGGVAASSHTHLKRWQLRRR